MSQNTRLIMPDEPEYIIKRCRHERTRRSQLRNELRKSGDLTPSRESNLAHEWYAFYRVECNYREIAGMREIDKIPSWVMNDGR